MGLGEKWKESRHTDPKLETSWTILPVVKHVCNVVRGKELLYHSSHLGDVFSCPITILGIVTTFIIFFSNSEIKLNMVSPTKECDRLQGTWNRPDMRNWFRVKWEMGKEPVHTLNCEHPKYFPSLQAGMCLRSIKWVAQIYFKLLSLCYFY